MLNYRTLEYKPTTSLKDENGRDVKYLDLLAKTWKSWEGDPYVNPIVVNEYYIARPDLISLAVYGDDKYGDLICKFNGISNPFELNEGMVLFIPDINWVNEGTDKRETSACDLITPGETIQTKDKLKSLRTDARSSSTPTVGDAAPFVIDKTLGLVFY